MNGAYLRTFFRGSSVSLAGTGLLGIINYLIRRKLSIDLPIAEYGAFYAMFALFALIFGLADIGLNQTGTLMIAAAADVPPRRDAVFSQLFLLKGISAVLCSCGIVIFFELTGRAGQIAPGLLLIMGMLFVFQTLNGTFQALWNGLKKFGTQQVFLLLTSGLTLALLYGAGGAESLKGAALFFAAASAAALLGGLLYSQIGGVGQLRLQFRRKICRTLILTGGQIAVSTSLLSFMYYMDTIMLNSLKGPESAGLYNVALPLMQIVQALMVFPSVFLPIAVEMERKGEYAKLLRFVGGAVLVTIAAVGPVWVFFHWSSAFLIRILFDAKYIAAAPAVTVLCVGLLFFTLGNFLLQIMFCLRKTGVMIVISAAAAVLNFVLNYVLINRNDVLGAAQATLVSYLIFALLTGTALLYSLKRRCHVQQA